MKNFLRILAAYVLAFVIAPFRLAAITAWIWLPLLMNHWSGIIIGVVIYFIGEILYYKFFGDN